MLDEIPEATDDEPVLWEENREHYRAFWDLHPDRALHMGGPGFIPLIAMIAYCAVEELEVKPLMRDLRVMDGAYLKFVADKQKEETEQRERESKRESRKGGGRARR